MLEVRTEKFSYSVNEKKTINPTIKLVGYALGSAGFRKGVWLLRSPHRTRKRGAERFRAMRMEGTGIRIRCKPGGNETCYEWTLLPPPGMDADSVFSELCTIHPNTMRSTRGAISSLAEEVSVLGGLFERVADHEPKKLPVEECVSEPHQEATQDEDAAPADTAGPKEISEEIEPPSRICSLDLSSCRMPLSSSFALDRALLAFYVCSGGSDFIRRNAVSEGLVELLNIVGLTKESETYNSVKLAMRAILMGCCEAGYLERIMYGENSTNGYRLTEEGKNRLAFLKSIVDGPVAQKVADAVKAKVKSERKVEVKKEAVPVRADETITFLRRLIGEHDSVKKELEEIGQLVSELKGETENDELMMSGLGKALGEKLGERDDLNREIGRLEAKLVSLRAAMDKKASDMTSLNADLQRLSDKKAEIESKFSER